MVTYARVCKDMLQAKNCMCTSTGVTTKTFRINNDQEQQPGNELECSMNKLNE